MWMNDDAQKKTTKLGGKLARWHYSFVERENLGVRTKECDSACYKMPIRNIPNLHIRSLPYLH